MDLGKLALGLYKTTLALQISLGRLLQPGGPTEAATEQSSNKKEHRS